MLRSQRARGGGRVVAPRAARRPMMLTEGEGRFAELAAQVGDPRPARMCVAMRTAGVPLAAGAAFVEWMPAIAPLLGAVVVAPGAIETGGRP